MKLSKKQCEVWDYVTKVGKTNRRELRARGYADTVSDALISKGILVEYKNVITEA